MLNYRLWIDTRATSSHTSYSLIALEEYSTSWGQVVYMVQARSFTMKATRIDSWTTVKDSHFKIDTSERKVVISLKEEHGISIDFTRIAKSKLQPLDYITTLKKRIYPVWFICFFIVGAFEISLEWFAWLIK